MPLPALSRATAGRRLVRHRLVGSRFTALALAAALCAVLALPAAAQPQWWIGARAGYADLSASGIYDDVYDGGTAALGLQGEVRWPSFLLRLAAERMDADGNLFVPDTVGDGNVLPGSEIELGLDLYHLTAAYDGGTGGAWGWFAGGGLTYADAEEEAEFLRNDNTASGFHLVAGARRAFAGRWEVGGELMYFNASDLLDVEGFAADDLEGFSGTVSVAFGF